MRTEQIPRYLWIGRNDKNWYFETEKTISEIFGQEKSKTAAYLLAATSINSSLKSNLSLFKKALHQLENNLPFEKYLPVMKKQLDSYRLNGQLSGRKINNFAQAMSGDTRAVVVDIWILRAFGYSNKSMRNTGPHKGLMREGGATKRQYDLIEAYIQTEAPLMGLQPREMCSMIWSGARASETGFRNTTRYCEILRHQFSKLDLFSNQPL